MNECRDEAKESCKNDSEFLDFVIAKSAERGSVITKDDINAAIVSNIPADKELSENQLENITGGEEKDAICLLDYYCFTAYHHDDEMVENKSCWSDYYCLTVIHH